MKTYISSVTDRTVSTKGVFSQKQNSSQSFAENLKEFSDKSAPQQGVSGAGSSVMLVGEISSSSPTVSELLMQHDKLKGSTWNILSAEQNQDKDFTRISSGTKVYYDSSDGSLRWGGASAEAMPVAPQRIFSPQSTTVSPVTVVERANPESLNVKRVELGVIDSKNPTVSHLLKANAELGGETWNILSSAVNQNKDFTSLPVGASVHIDPQSHEVSWRTSVTSNTSAVTVDLPVAAIEPAPTGVKEVLPATGEAEASSILLGRIDRKNPTVSHLLQQHPEHREGIWSVLNSDLNRDKPFHAIAPGTEIYLQPGSQEIVWTTAMNIEQRSAPAAARGIIPAEVASVEPRAVLPDGRATDLTEAVQPFMGKSYKEINCYELLVKGLERMDIPYTGKDGLLGKLTDMAREKGLPANAFMNGEGIVKAAGSLVLSRNYPRTSNWKREAEQLYEEMTPLLDKGQILSFSTQKRGHTGIVSQQHDQWTFINSGRLDNALTANNPSQGVGEEVLKREIRNWFKLANKSGESLTVTLGAIKAGGVVTALNVPITEVNGRHI